jgi:hypothetical protein
MPHAFTYILKVHVSSARDLSGLHLASESDTVSRWLGNHDRSRGAMVLASRIIERHVRATAGKHVSQWRIGHHSSRKTMVLASRTIERQLTITAGKLLFSLVFQE